MLDELNRAKPASAKGRYLRKIVLSSTMGPGVKVDPTAQARSRLSPSRGRRTRAPAASSGWPGAAPTEVVRRIRAGPAAGLGNATRAGTIFRPNPGSRRRPLALLRAVKGPDFGPTRRGELLGTLVLDGVRCRERPEQRKEVSMMENPRPEKVAVVDEVREKLSGADAALLTEYRGLTVKQLAELRRALRPAGGEYKVYKNTLVRFAAREVVEDRWTRCSPARRPSPSSRATRRPSPRPCATSPGATTPSCSRAACSATRSSRRPGRRGPGRPAVPRRAAGPARRSLPGAAGQAGRPAAGPAAELRLRPQGPHRPARRSPRPPADTPTTEPARPSRAGR